MSIFNKAIILAILFCSFFSAKNYAASNCQKPFLQSFSELTTSSAKMKWFDSNANATGWEMEIGPIGFNPTEIPNTPIVNVKEYTFSGLAASSRYEVWIRTICDACTSGWNGPFIFNTNIENGSACNIGLSLKDDNCPLAETYNISVNNAGGNALGSTIFIEEINVIITHDWPSDLNLELTSPSGKTIVLIAHRGIGQDHMGIPNPGNCDAILSFTNEACSVLDLHDGPLVGSFKPEEDINTFLDDSNPNGIWELKICDRADEDLGVLQHFEIKFNTEVCPIPAKIIVKEINATRATMSWEAPFNCTILQYKVGPSGGDVNNFVCQFVNCQLEEVDLPGLSPGTSYDLYVKSECFQINSPFSCAMSFTTACEEITALDNFDNQPTCATSCLDACLINGNWTNTYNNDDHDWIINQGNTPSSFTGPDDDPFESGNYIYIENSVGICGDHKAAILESNCLFVQASSCDFSFFYHMFGINSNQLSLEISIDQASTWQEIWSLSGSQSNLWERAEIDLNAYDQKMVKLRFIALSGNGTAGDIALDQLEFYGSQFTNDGTLVFADMDMDGFGAGDSLRYCGAIIPAHLSTNNLDCNDNDSSINPSQTESPCNLIDENCNGPEDDAAPVNPINYSITNIDDESCLGSNDGRITISITGGSSPYTVDWNNLMDGTNISMLAKGVYYATITDASGCMMEVDFIEIDAQTSMQLFVQNITDPMCNGVENGSITVVANGGQEPYNYLWDNGEQSNTATMLSAGLHQVTITDALGCILISQKFQLDAPPLLEAGTQLITPVSCNGGSDGSILISVIQGTPPFDILWNTLEDTPLITQLTAGFYSCTITDALGCIKTLSDIEIVQNDSMEIFIDGIEDIRCAFDQDGRIEISIEGGTPPYSYFWNNGAFTDDLFGLDVGIYGVTVTDIKGCQAMLDDISINAPDPIAAGIDSILHVDCPFSEHGYVALDVTGGTGNYNFYWNTLSDNSPIQDSLETGTYGLTIIDDFNCKETPINITIDAINEPLDLAFIENIDNLCFGESMGSISVAVFSNRSPFDFNWSAGIQNSANIAQDQIINLPNANYNVTVTDAEGCVGISDSVSIESPEDLVFAIDSLEHIACHGDSSGLIGISIDGGRMPYDIVWSNLDSGALIDRLDAGLYSFEITDANNCKKASQDIEIIQADSLLLSAVLVDELSNNGAGSISVTAIGGTPDYHYTWSNNAMSGDVDQAIMLSSDLYSLTLSDFNNCEIDTSFFIDNISSIEETALGSIRLLANVSNNEIVIMSEIINTTPIEVQIINATGQLLMYESHSIALNNRLVIPIAQLTTGAYFLKVFSRGQVKSHKFIKI